MPTLTLSTWIYPTNGLFTKCTDHFSGPWGPLSAAHYPTLEIAKLRVVFGIVRPIAPVATSYCHPPELPLPRSVFPRLVNRNNILTAVVGLIGAPEHIRPIGMLRSRRPADLAQAVRFGLIG